MAALDFKTEEKNDALIIKFPKFVEASAKDDLEKNIKMWQLKELKLFVFDLKETDEIDRSLYKTVIDFKKNLERVGKSLATISVSSHLKQNLTAEGMATAFNIFSTLNEAYKYAGIKLIAPNRIKIDTNFINPFIAGTMVTFQTQAGITLTPGKPTVKKPEDITPGISLAGVINLTCTYFTGSIGIAFPKNVFLSIYNKMLDEKYEDLTDEVKDGAGELLNIVYGHAKTELNKQGYKLEKAIPTIMAGDNLHIHSNRQSPSIILNCTGLDLLKRVRKDSRFKDVPFVLLTAESEASQVKEAIMAGVDNYITKPFNAETLGQKLETVYKKRAA